MVVHTEVCALVQFSYKFDGKLFSVLSYPDTN